MSKLYSHNAVFNCSGPPILISKRVFPKDQKLTLEALFHSNPKADFVTWRYNDKVFQEDLDIVNQVQQVMTERIIYQKRVSGPAYTASITLRGVKQQDIKLYSCQIKNDFGYIDASFDNYIEEVSTTENGKWFKFVL